MFYFVLFLHIIVCLALMVVVLLQSGKGGGLSGAFGGSGMSNVMGGKEASGFLSKATTWIAILFMVTTISLALMSRPADSATQSAGGAIGEIQEGKVQPTLGQESQLEGGAQPQEQAQPAEEAAPQGE